MTKTICDYVKLVRNSDLDRVGDHRISRAIFASLAVLAACAGSSLALSTAALPLTDPPAIPAALCAASGAASFAYNPTLLTGTASTAAINTYPGAGLKSSRTAAHLPAILGSGLSQTYLEVRIAAQAMARALISQIISITCWVYLQTWVMQNRAWRVMHQRNYRSNMVDKIHR